MAALFNLIHALRASTTHLSTIYQAIDHLSKAENELTSYRLICKSWELDLQVSCVRFRGFGRSVLADKAEWKLAKSPRRSDTASHSLFAVSVLQEIQDVVNRLDEILDGIGIWSSKSPLESQRVTSWKAFLHSKGPPSGPDEEAMVRDFVTMVHHKGVLVQLLKEVRLYADRCDAQIRTLVSVRAPTISFAPISDSKNERWSEISTAIVQALRGRETLALSPPTDLDGLYSFLQYRICSETSRIPSDHTRRSVSLAACNFAKSSSLWHRPRSMTGKIWHRDNLLAQGKVALDSEDMRSSFYAILKLDNSSQEKEREATYDDRIEAAFFVVMALTYTRLSGDIVAYSKTDCIKNVRIKDGDLTYRIPVLDMQREPQAQTNNSRRFLVIGITLAELALAQPVDPDENGRRDLQTLGFRVCSGNESKLVEVGELLLMVKSATTLQYSDAVAQCFRIHTDLTLRDQDAKGERSVLQFVSEVYHPMRQYYQLLKTSRSDSPERERQARRGSEDLPKALQHRSSGLSRRSTASLISEHRPARDSKFMPHGEPLSEEPQRLVTPAR